MGDEDPIKKSKEDADWEKELAEHLASNDPPEPVKLPSWIRNLMTARGIARLIPPGSTSPEDCRQMEEKLGRYVRAAMAGGIRDPAQAIEAGATTMQLVKLVTPVLVAMEKLNVPIHTIDGSAEDILPAMLWDLEQSGEPALRVGTNEDDSELFKYVNKRITVEERRYNTFKGMIDAFADFCDSRPGEYVYVRDADSFAAARAGSKAASERKRRERKRAEMKGVNKK